MSQMILDVQAFLETGGGVLNFIGIVTLTMWTLMLERFYYFYQVFPKVAEEVQEKWASRDDHSSWSAHQVRRLLVSELRMQLEDGLAYIRVLVALCPLLGLLGTVTGMIEVFDVMAIAGSGNARAMAGGVSKATIPTMAGMVAALSGLLLSAQLEKYAQDEGDRVADRMVIEHDWDAVRRVMWDYVGIVRSRQRLEIALDRLRAIRATVEGIYRSSQIDADLAELRNISLLGELIVRSALHRRESRGLHYTLDHSAPADRPLDTLVRGDEVRSTAREGR